MYWRNRQLEGKHCLATSDPKSIFSADFYQQLLPGCSGSCVQWKGLCTFENAGVHLWWLRKEFGWKNHSPCFDSDHHHPHLHYCPYLPSALSIWWHSNTCIVTERAPNLHFYLRCKSLVKYLSFMNLRVNLKTRNTKARLLLGSLSWTETEAEMCWFWAIDSLALHKMPCGVETDKD